MNALITGIAAFFIAALGVVCPHDFVYLPALLSIIVVGGYVGGTIFSLQSDGVYALHIRADRATSNAADARLGGIWAYGLVGVPAGAIALLIVARVAGIDDSVVGAFMRLPTARLMQSAGNAGSVVPALHRSELPQPDGCSHNRIAQSQNFARNVTPTIRGSLGCPRIKPELPV